MFFVPLLSRIESNRIESNIGLVESNRFRIVNFRNDADSNGVEYNLNRIESNRIDLRFSKSQLNQIESNIASVESNRMRMEFFSYFSVSDVDGFDKKGVVFCVLNKFTQKLKMNTKLYE